MSKIIGSDLDFGGVAKILNLPNPVSAQEPATKAYAESLFEGTNWKTSARVAAPANVNLSAPGATLDGISMVLNDRFLAPNQTAQPSNGIYIWNGAAIAATRSLDANTAKELEQATISIEEGSSAGTSYRQSTVNFVLDTGNIVFGPAFASAPPASEATSGIAELATQAEMDSGVDDLRIVTPLKAKNASWQIKKYSIPIGDGSATQFTITHNLNSKNVVVAIYLTGGTFDEVFADIKHTTVNSLTINFAAAPSASQYTVVVIG